MSSQCTVLTVTHPVARPYFDFHIAQIFIDDELNVPIRYCAYSWPTSPGGEPVLLEEYTYQNLKTNIGLTDADSVEVRRHFAAFARNFGFTSEILLVRNSWRIPLRLAFVKVY